MEIITNPPHKQPGLLYPLMLLAAIALIVFSIAGIATMMGWMPGAADRAPAEKAGPVPAAGALCADCGVVESIRASKGEAGMGAVTYQIRVRMGDGATRTFTESDRPAVAVGQRVRVTERGIAAAG
jgi:hypothetical protein